MAKRFTDTEKWNGNWFCSLDPKEKLIWIYICDRCDHAGIFEINEKLMSFHLGFKVDSKAINTLLKGKAYPISETKLFLPAFVQFQYGELTENCKPHRPTINILSALNLLPVLEEYKKERVLKGYPKGINTLQEKEKEEEKEKDQEQEDKTPANDNEPFSQELAFVEDPDFKALMATWLGYKKARRESYKDAKSIEACFKKLMKLSYGNKETANQIIQESMANNWAGLFELKPGYSKANKPSALPSPAGKYKVD